LNNGSKSYNRGKEWDSFFLKEEFSSSPDERDWEIIAREDLGIKETSRMLISNQHKKLKSKCSFFNKRYSA
jgi:hypothetical protein